MKQKLKKMDLTSLVIAEKKLTKVLYVLKGSIGKKRFQLKNVSYCIHCKVGWKIPPPGIYQWTLPVFPDMANKAQVANTGK